MIRLTLPGYIAVAIALVIIVAYAAHHVRRARRAERELAWRQARGRAS